MSLPHVQQPQLFQPGTARNRRVILKVSKPKGNKKLADILGLNTVLNSKDTRMKKVFIAISFLTCITLFAWQLGVSVHRYISYPIATVSTKKEAKETYLPSICVCNNHMIFPKPIDALANVKNDTKITKECLYEVKIDNNNTNITVEDMEKVWTEYGLYPRVLSWRPTNYFRGDKLDSDMNISFVNTMQGRCIDIAFVKPYYYAADVYIRRHPEIQKCNATTVPEGYSVYIHPQNVMYIFDVYANTRLSWMGIHAKLFFERKEYYYLNVPRNPCVSLEEHIQCKKQCVIEILEKHISCKVLSMEESSLPFCTTWKDVLRVVKTFDALQINGTLKNCSCSRPCEVVEYKLSHYESGHNKFKYRAMLSVTVLNDFDEVLKEEYAYPLTSLINDFAAIIGFFLGMSLFGIFNIMDSLGSKLYEILKE